jgi:hypothetical protein
MCAWVGIFIVINRINHGVPNQLICQVQGAGVLFLITQHFTALSVSVYDRYWTLVNLRDINPPSSGIALHWSMYKFGVLPFLTVFSALPLLTSGKFGFMEPFPNNSFCVPAAGRGVLAHDVYPLLIILHFLICVYVIAGSSYRSLVIVRSLFSTAVQSTSAMKKRDDAERRFMWHSVVTTLHFLACEDASGRET